MDYPPILQEEVKKLVALIKEYIENKRTSSLESGDLAELIRAEFELRELMDPYFFKIDEKKLMWIFGYGGPLADGAFKWYKEWKDSKKDPTLDNKEAEYAREMYGLLKDMPDKPEQVKVTLKRVRTEGGNNWTYRVLAIFPEGNVPASRITAVSPQEVFTTDKPLIIYFSAQTGCVNHACDLLYKELRDSEKTGYIPFMSSKRYSEFIRTLRPDNEFMDKETRETLDHRAYVSAGISGHFSNERNLCIIPKELLVGK